MTRHTLIVGCAASMLVVAGCESAPKAAEAPEPSPAPVYLATWTPSSAPKVVTIQRQSTITIVEAERDLFVVQTEGVSDDGDWATITWVISTPAADLGPGRYPFAVVSAELARSGPTTSAGNEWNAPPEEAPEGHAYGWAIVERVGYPRTTRPVTGEIEIVGLDTDHAAIQMQIDTPGVADTLVFEGECVRVNRPASLATAPLQTRSGVPHRAKEEEKPKGTDPAWPWNEVFAEPSDFYSSL